MAAQEKKIDDILKLKFKQTRKNKSLFNIRTKNKLNSIYSEMKRDGRIEDFKIVGVKIKNRVQSVAIKLVQNSSIMKLTYSLVE